MHAPISVPAVDLADARTKVVQLFHQVVAQQVVEPGITEAEASERVRELAGLMFGIIQYWHKRIVRSGPNTIHPYRENPPDRRIEADDIVYLDLGPVFGTMEADFGRTWVFGDNPQKHQLVHDLRSFWDQGQAAFRSQPEMTGQALYALMDTLATQAGYRLADWHVGHMLGEFPHKQVQGEESQFYFNPESTLALHAPDATGQPRHWVLEVHLIHPSGEFGGFFEDLLTV